MNITISKSRLLIYLSAIIIFCIGAFLVSFYYYTNTNNSQNQTPLPIKEEAPQKLSLQPTNAPVNSVNEDNKEQTTATPEANKDVSDAKQTYDNYVNELKQIVFQQDPQVALNKITVDVQTNKTVQNRCHKLTHEVGNFALEKFDNNITQAMTYAREICGSGYMHGLIEKFIVLSPDPEKEIISLCNNSSNTGGCYHGLGHGIMIYKDYDVKKSVEICSRINSNSFQIACGEGVFMELFDFESVEEIADENLPDYNPREICDVYNSLYQDTCYYYAGRYLYNTIQNEQLSLSECLKFDTKNIDSCVRGMSAGIVRNHLLEPEKMENYCEFANNYKPTCYVGAVNYHLFILGKPDDTKNEMCNKFVQESNRAQCHEKISISPFR